MRKLDSNTVKLTSDEIAVAIDEYLAKKGFVVKGPRTINVNGELIQEGSVYVDPSGSLTRKNPKTMQKLSYLSQIEQVWRGLRILQKTSEAGVSAEHDQIFAGDEGEDIKVSKKDTKKLVALGWFIDDDVERWSRFV